MPLLLLIGLGAAALLLFGSKAIGAPVSGISSGNSLPGFTVTTGHGYFFSFLDHQGRDATTLAGMLIAQGWSNNGNPLQDFGPQPTSSGGSAEQWLAATTWLGPTMNLQPDGSGSFIGTGILPPDLLLVGIKEAQ